MSRGHGGSPRKKQRQAIQRFKRQETERSNHDRRLQARIERQRRGTRQIDE